MAIERRANTGKEAISFVRSSVCSFAAFRDREIHSSAAAVIS
jgi:hypothetical protein